MDEEIRNEGFSLVELVIVIAIMAILVALLAPQYIKYVEKSRMETDIEIATSVHDAVTVAMADENIEERPLDGFSDINIEQIGVSGYTDKPYTEFVATIKSFLQVDDLGTIKNRFKSKAYSNEDIKVRVDGATQKVTVTVSSNVPGSVDDLIIK
ncbi:MAG: type II secretion system protein [Lachnospiraceae bacterium]|nr:type II secretion system protein [Lachnospiraceae bacterium]